MLVGVFDVDELIAACEAANQETEPRRAIREVLAEAMSRPTEVGDALRPTEGGITQLHLTPDLTILHVVWAPGMRIFPHDHRMWAAIGIYAGEEDNAFYRRSAPGATGLVESGGKTLATGDSVVLGADTIHGVANTRDRLAGAIHVYGGDLVHQARSQWGPGPLEERPYDIDLAREEFEKANQAWKAATS